MAIVNPQNRGPKAKRGRSKMRMGEISADEYRSTALLQILAILIILGLLLVVAIPRFVDTRRDRLQEAEEAEAHSFMRALHGVLTVNTANHYLRGVKWVQNGETLMGLLEEDRAMPEGMRYADNVWTDKRTGLQWEFKGASGRLPPRIRRVEQRLPPENWEMEPIVRGAQSRSPDS